MIKAKVAVCRMLLVACASITNLSAFAQEAAPTGSDEIARARKLYMACAACHTNDASGQSGAGPNLKGIVGRPIGKAKGFTYSTAMRGAKGTWTPERLSEFLKSPNAALPGTNMAFAGFSKEEDRAAIVRYLQSTK